MKEINENDLIDVVGGADSNKNIPDTYTVVSGVIFLQLPRSSIPHGRSFTS